MKITLEETNDIEVSSIKVIPSDAKIIVLRLRQILRQEDIDNMEQRLTEKFGTKVVIIENRVEVEGAVLNEEKLI